MSNDNPTPDHSKDSDQTRGDNHFEHGDFEEYTDTPADTSRDFSRSTRDADLASPKEELVKVRKKRKNQEAAPEWDRDESRKETEPDDSGQPLEKKQRKETKKKRPPTKIEKLFLASPKLFLALFCLVLGIIVVAGTVLVIVNALKKAESVVAVPPDDSENEGLDPEIESLMPNFITYENEKGAEAAISAYLQADGWEKKLEHVRNAEAVSPLMERWYQNPKYTGQDNTRQLGEVIFRKQAPIAGKIFVMLAVNVLPERKIQFFAVEKTPNGRFAIDWESSEGYQEIPLNEFKLTKPTTPTTFRVQAKISDYYNGDYIDGERFQCFELYYPGRPEFRIYGYVDKSTAFGRNFIEAVPVNTTQSLIVDIAFPEKPKSSDQVNIVDLKRTNWFL